MSIDELKAALERVLQGQASREDRNLLREAVQRGAISLATGERALAVGGDAGGATIVTGDGNVLLQIQAEDTSARSILSTLLLPRLHQLPPDVADFEGRQDQVSELLKLLEHEGGRAAITAIGGMSGIGKTVLAAHVGHHLAGRYPDGQLFVELEGTSEEPTSPAAAMATVIRSFEPAAQLPETGKELQPIYLSILEGKRVLIVLDNARDSAQVEPLMPPASCAAIITSRRQVAVPGVTAINLDVMSESEAVSLLRSLVGDARANEQQLAEIAKLCGYLPLALRVAGTFLQLNTVWDTADYIQALEDERTRLKRLVVGGTVDLDVAASLSLSVTQLQKDRAELVDRWHALGVFPGSLALAAAAAVWGQEMEKARDTMTPLVGCSMVLYDSERERFRLHDLMRDLANGQSPLSSELPWPDNLEELLERAAAAHSQHFVQVLALADDLFLKGGEGILQGLALFDQERKNIEAGQNWAASREETDAAYELCAGYPNVGAYVLSLRLVADERVRWLEAAVQAARQLGDRRGEGNALGNLGIAYANLGETRKAIEHHEQALTIAREIGDRRGECQDLGNLGNAYTDLGETRRAIEHHEQALTIAREIGDRGCECKHLGNLGNAYAELGETRKAVEHIEQALTIAREIGDRRSEGAALDSLGLAYANLGETRKAVEHIEQALTIAREIGDRKVEGAALGSLGTAYATLGETRKAIEHHEQALTIAREIGDRRGEGSAIGNIGLAYANLGETGKAIELYEQHLEIAREIGDRRGERQRPRQPRCHLCCPRRAPQSHRAHARGSDNLRRDPESEC